MSTCAIRFRLNAPGPSTFIVELNGGMRMYTRGTLGGRLPEQYALSLTTSTGNNWVPASGELILDVDLDDDVARGWDVPAVALVPSLAATSAVGAHGPLLA